MRFQRTSMGTWSRIGLHLGLPLALVLAAAMIARAYDTTWIQSGQPISAMKLKAALDEIQTRLTAGGYAASTAAVSGSFSAGNKVGYQVAKDLCVQVVGDPVAHMCTTDEIVRSIQLGKLGAPSAPFWVGGGSGTSINATADCNGFTNSSNAVTGMTVQASGVPGYPVLLPASCSAVAGIACCK